MATQKLDAIADQDHALPNDLRTLASIRDVLAWMECRGLPLESLDMVTQDEFTHDVLVPLGPSGGWAVFGVT